MCCAMYYVIGGLSKDEALNIMIYTNKRPRGLDVCQQHCKKSAINVSDNVYLYSKIHYHEKMYILYIDHWHLYYYVRFP